ncbi:calcium-transporting ATPase 2 [Pyronema domesticum]|nr:calcium-transporting ATPase 2 [Pyronema domesticum]
MAPSDIPNIQINIAADDSSNDDGVRRLSNPETLHTPNTLAPSTFSKSRSSSVSGATLTADDESIAPPHKPSTVAHCTDAELAVIFKPDAGNEQDFQPENSPFAFSVGQLNKFLNPKSLDAFKAVGGIKGLEKGLQTDLTAGLSIDECAVANKVTFEEAIQASETSRDVTSAAHVSDGSAGSFSDRKRIFKDNSLPSKKAKSLWRLMWEQYQDKILILLTVAAVISLALGLYETFGVVHAPGAPPAVDWIEGVAICVAIVIVVLVGSLNDWQKERQFVKLNAKKEDREVKVIRSGKSIQINVVDILVGDVLHLEPGDMIPADGIFISGHNVKCDESSATGESDQMKKTAGDEVYRRILAGTADGKLDCFMISGSKVLEGVGTYLVTSTGVNSSFGKLMMSLHQEVEPTPLQVKLGKIADAIAYLGGGAALVLFMVLFFRFCAGLPSDSRPAAEKGSAFLDILIVAITLIVVAIPEGLPLAVTLALAFATTRMLKENNLVRVLRACETMGNATTVCSDKTGTLTQNKMTVVAGIIGTNEKFFMNQDQPQAGERTPRDTVAAMSPTAKELLLKSIALNSTAFDGEENGEATFIGSKTETAMLSFARDYLGMQSVQIERTQAETVQMIPFDSKIKCMGCVVKIPKGPYRFFVKGASEILLEKTSHTVSDLSSEHIGVSNLSVEDKESLKNTINEFAGRSLRTIGIVYKDYAAWPPAGVPVKEDAPNEAQFGAIFQDMIFLGIVGIMDPLRPGVPEAVRQCQHAGVTVRMVTGDNLITAKAIARDCGILTETGISMEGPQFRNLTESEMDAILPNLQVLARSSPEDKKILVGRLKFLGETVAVTGDGTNDGPALKMADVGFSMGIAGTEVAKEASSIILMDDNFASIIKALMWGRAVNDAVQKFLQFQLTVNITAVFLTFVSAVSSAKMESVLTAVQLLWVNLIMDTFAALALATDAPTPEILNRKPSPKSAPLVTLNMWKMIIGQAIFQLAVTYVLYFGGRDIFPASWTEKELRTVVFNTFVWMQIFNEFNNRRLDNKFNIFQGIQHNYFFIGINCIMVGGQVMIVYVGGAAFSITRINGQQWAVCVVLAALCVPWAIVIRLIPDEFVEKCWNKVTAICGPKVKACNDFFWRYPGKIIPKRFGPKARLVSSVNEAQPAHVQTWEMTEQRRASQSADVENQNQPR